jgi:SAM-dependent methyltransferase
LDGSANERRAAVTHDTKGQPPAAGRRFGDGGVHLEHSACAFCASGERRTVLTGSERQYGLPGLFSVVACTRCGLMRTDPRPTRDSIHLYYPREYSPYLTTADETTSIARRLARWLFDPLDIATPPIPPGRLLEIGTASGNFIVAMQRAGWEVTGVEFNEAAARVAAERTRRPVRHDRVDQVDFPPGSFDLICAWMVFEHLHDPVEQFRRCARWLRRGGWLAFSVPDCGGVQFRIFGKNWLSLDLPRHLYHFTPSLLGRILEACGFECVQTRWQRTLDDVSLSLAYSAESKIPRTGPFLRALARSVPSRALGRAAGVAAAPLHVSGRVTVWARKS